MISPIHQCLRIDLPAAPTYRSGGVRDMRNVGVRRADLRAEQRSRVLAVRDLPVRHAVAASRLFRGDQDRGNAR